MTEQEKKRAEKRLEKYREEMRIARLTNELLSNAMIPGRFCEAVKDTLKASYDAFQAVEAKVTELEKELKALTPVEDAQLGKIAKAVSETAGGDQRN